MPITVYQAATLRNTIDDMVTTAQKYQSDPIGTCDALKRMADGLCGYIDNFLTEPAAPEPKFNDGDEVIRDGVPWRVWSRQRECDTWIYRLRSHDRGDGGWHAESELHPSTEPSAPEPQADAAPIGGLLLEVPGSVTFGVAVDRAVAMAREHGESVRFEFNGTNDVRAEKIKQEAVMVLDADASNLDQEWFADWCIRMAEYVVELVDDRMAKASSSTQIIPDSDGGL
jgi:hypothetical protein